MEFDTDPSSADRVWFGAYGISPSTRKGMIWLEHESGEGMEIPEASLVTALHQFYKENF